MSKRTTKPDLEWIESVGKAARFLADERIHRRALGLDPDLAALQHVPSTEPREIEVVEVRRIPNPRQLMPAKRKKAGAKTKIYAWPVSGSTQIIEGVSVTPKYITYLYDDGTLSCDCPGWCFWRDKTKPRSCRHCEQVRVESQELHRAFKAGEELPAVEMTGDQPRIVPKKEADKNLPFGRFVDL